MMLEPSACRWIVRNLTVVISLYNQIFQNLTGTDRRQLVDVADNDDTGPFVKETNSR